MSRKEVNSGKHKPAIRPQRFPQHMKRNNKRWSSSEDSILRQYYENTPVSAIMKMLPGRTATAIASRACALRLTRHHKPWTAEEDEIIRTHYTDMTASQLVNLLPDRTQVAISTRACALGVSKRIWTAKEDQFLVDNAQSMSVRHIARAMHNRSYCAVVERMKELNLIQTDPARKVKRWTKAEDDIIRANYGTMSASQLTRLLPCRTKSAIQIRAAVLANKGKSWKMPRWSEDEDEIIREHYGVTPIREMIELLPGRSYPSIVQHARALQLDRRTKWTEEEDNVLKENYMSSTGKELSKLLHGRSVAAIQRRAFVLGISKRQRK